MCVCVLVRCSEAAAHAVATLAEATLQGGGQIVLAETAAAVGALAGVQDATGTHSPGMLSTSRRKKAMNPVSCSTKSILLLSLALDDNIVRS